jgi:hypothetical protein
MNERPLKLYEVEERLAGTAFYEIEAHSAAEARQKLRAGEHGGMLGSQVEHTGQCRIRRASEPS